MGGDEFDEEVTRKLEPTAFSCLLNTAACKLKMQLWQEALESCNEVHVAVLVVCYRMFEVYEFKLSS